jgi:spermidine synthase
MAHVTNPGKSENLKITGFEICLISFIILFQELTLIRWLPGQVRVLAYFPNLILLGSFLGLGLGCLRADRKSLLWLWPLSLFLLAVVADVMSRIVFTASTPSEHPWLLYYDLPQGAPIFNSVYFPIISGFILCTLTFIPLGQVLADRLNIFQKQSSTLWGYIWDLTGSLLGVVAFSCTNLLNSFPWTWFATILVLGFVYFIWQTWGRVLYLLLAAGIIVTVVKSERASVYSPYYAISVRESKDQSYFKVLTNGSLHQVPTKLKRSDRLLFEWQEEAREGYHFPYHILAHPPKRALVLGAGTGNDVAVLLDEGAEAIDAVEIDPMIIRLGQNHPDHPYSSPKVNVINADARQYLNNTKKTYDLIVFGTLDSMTKLSALSNVRLDNFVYSTDCLRAAKSHLTSDGGMILYFMASSDYIHTRLIGMLALTFQKLPLVREKNSKLFNKTYMAGPAFSHLAAQDQKTDLQYFKEILPNLELPDDDWPYLYLRDRGVSGFYLVLISVFLFLGVLSVFFISPEMKQSFKNLKTIDVEMFLFGLAFLLLETKLVVAMTLVWGATWLTSAVVFASVLGMILVSTLLTQVKPMSWRIAMGGLIITLAATYFIPTHTLLFDNFASRLLASLFYIGTPLFFAAACFALCFKKRSSPNLALGWNLLGAVTGGLMEFLSMAVGLRALSLLALVAYLVIMLIHIRKTSYSNRIARS